MPSEYLETGESLEQGAARETYEETGLVIMFRVELPAKPTLIPGRECLEVAFLSEDEIPHDQFVWRSVMGDGPERFLRELRSREFTIQLISFGSSDGTGFRSREYKIRSIHNTVRDRNGRWR